MIRGGHEGYERLQLLSRVRWRETSRLFDEIGVSEGMDCLDVGCGGGAVTLELARIVAPGGRAVGIDMDELKLELARADAVENDVRNIAFRSVDVNDWAEPESYDLVYTRFLLEHLSRPLGLLERMWAAVRPGGTLAVEDADFDGLHSDPPNEGFEFWRRINPAVLESHGGDPRIGRKLHRYFLEAGIGNPKVRLTQDVNTAGEAKTLPEVTLAAMSDAIEDAGLSSRAELVTAIESLTSYSADPTTLVAGPRVFQVWSRKPASRLPHQHPAVHVERRSGREARLVRDEEGDERCHLLGPAEAADRDRLHQRLDALWRQRCDHRPVDGSGRDGVHGHALRRELRRRTTRQGHDRGLRGRVVHP